MKKFIAIVGTSYPEIHGATNVTEFFTNILKNNEINILRLSYKNYFFIPNANTSFLEAKLSKFISFIGIYLNILRNIKSINALYLQENSGFGKIYDISFLILFIIFRKKCFYHNHTYNKIKRYDLNTKVIQFISKFGVKNIFQSRTEAKNFIRIYGKIKYTIISNSVFIKTPQQHQRKFAKNKQINFGLISNLNKFKGLDLFIKIAQDSATDNNPWFFHLAGPIIEQKNYYLKKIHLTKKIKYHGPIFNPKQKESFYQNIDFFIFLSSYKKESEALVMLEAISNGCVPIVYDQGQLGNLVGEKKLIIPKDIDPYLYIKNLIRDISFNNELENLSSKSINLFNNLKINSQNNLKEIVKEIKDVL